MIDRKEKIQDAISVVIQSWDRCQICGAENTDAHDSEPHGFTAPDAVALLVEELRGVGLEIRPLMGDRHRAKPR